MASLDDVSFGVRVHNATLLQSFDIPRSAPREESQPSDHVGYARDSEQQKGGLFVVGIRLWWVFFLGGLEVSRGRDKDKDNSSRKGCRIPEARYGGRKRGKNERRKTKSSSNSRDPEKGDSGSEMRWRWMGMGGRGE